MLIAPVITTMRLGRFPLSQASEVYFLQTCEVYFILSPSKRITEETIMKKLNWKQAWVAKCQLLRPNDRLPRGIKQVKIEVEGPPEVVLGKPFGPAIWDEAPHMHNCR